MGILKFTKDSFTRNLAKGNLLVPYLERYDEWDHPFNFIYSPKQGDDGWHPSGDCTPSVLDLYEKATGQGEPDIISPTLQRTFLVGHFWHQVIQDALVRLEFATPDSVEQKGMRAWSFGSSGEREPYHYVTGSGDVAPLVLPNWEGILDIKTMHDQAFNNVVKTGLLPGRFAEKYEAQINVYMSLFDQSAGMILGVNKGSSQFCEIVFERNQDLIDVIFEKWRYVSECLNEGHPPDPRADEILALPFKGPVS